MKLKLLVILGVILLIMASFCGCSEDDDDDDENGNGGEGESESESESEGEGFKLYDSGFDFQDANEDSKPMTGLEAITLAIVNINSLAPGSSIGVMSSTDLDGEGASKDTGKAIAWQIYFYKTVDGQNYSRIVNVAENGGYLVKDDYTVAYKSSWDHESATIDTDELSAAVSDHQDTQDWLTAHPSATLTIQTANGIPLGTEELSWLLWYEDGADQHQVYVSALDGEILE
jgi:hypothetical protein